MSSTNLDCLFHPRAVALVGITIANPQHWTRNFLNGFLEFGFTGRLFLVNPKGGEIMGHRVYPHLRDIPYHIDYVIGLVPAKSSPKLVEECADLGIPLVHFCTAGFSETGEDRAVALEARLTAAGRERGVRLLGPNCMGVYYPHRGMSWSTVFPKESGNVGLISQSGGNAGYLITEGGLRGIRFSKAISYGNGCDLNECDFLEYLANDTETEIVAVYIEGVRDGTTFRRVLDKLAAQKTVVLMKGGRTAGGARAAAGHTGALAGDNAAWDALCRQLGVIQVSSLDELVDVLVTLSFLPLPQGRNAALIGGGGGASVIITDEFEKRGLRVPQLPPEIIAEIRQFTTSAGNILRNPIDYGQSMANPDNVNRTIDIVQGWAGIDFLVTFISTRQFSQAGQASNQILRTMSRLFVRGQSTAKPKAIVIEPTIMPHLTGDVAAAIRDGVASGLPVYFSFAGAANAINLILSHYEQRSGTE